MLATEYATPIADLHQDHGRIWDLVDQLRSLLLRKPEEPALQTLTARLVNLLGAHSAAEDQGINPDIWGLGLERAHALLAEVERTRAPGVWVRVARRSQNEETGRER